jgi:CxxC-x17-CxxC domain-containing protein
MDKTLVCRECGAEFTFSEREQRFYADKGFTNEPNRCPGCRAARRAIRGEGYGVAGLATGVYGAGPGRREMFPAICTRCGKEARVPFQPRSDRPVYCSECFAQDRGKSGDRRPSDDGGG